MASGPEPAGEAGPGASGPEPAGEAGPVASGAALVGEGKGPRPGYVPIDLDDAHRELLRMLSNDDVDKIRRAGDDEAATFHMGLGLWIRNNWGLWGGSRLAVHFNGLGVRHPDDMSGIILGSFRYKLQGRAFPLRESVAEYQEYWRSMQTPAEASPKDGAKIAWGAVTGAGKGAVHLGVGVSDRSYWRYEYGSNRGVEPARPDEVKQLEALVAGWRASGRTPADIAR